ncbi:ABC transporter ATP-binding protein [Variovorax sp. V15]|uniref:ABC transporter ATP-binding protein n=1 Tax=Variovorax sp. V15 TaxID=3065952 RepID=UPI0034E8D4F4
MLRVSNLFLTFHPGTPLETRALDGMSVEIPDGQFVTVIGSNGAGKSTLLNAISGDLRVDSGRIEVAGVNVTHLPTWNRVGLVSRVFQDPMIGTCDALTIEENMALASMRGKKRSLLPALRLSQRSFYQEQLRKLGLGLEARLNDRIGLLSGGQRQAVSLLMASLQPSEILLLDEHTAALDPKTAAFILELTRAIVNEKRITTLMVTHSMKQALELGDRTLMLHKGQVVLDVSGEERKGMQVRDLLNMFERVQGEAIADDALLLS